MGIKRLGNTFFNSIRKKIVMVFLITTLLTSFVSVLILTSSIRFISRIEDMFTESVKFEAFVNALEKVDNNVLEYLTSEDSDVLMNFYFSKDNLLEIAEGLGGDNDRLETGDDLLLRDIVNLQKAYLEVAQEAVNAKQNKDADIYIAKYTEANNIIGYIKNFINRLNLNRFDDNTDQFLNLSDNISNLITANIILIIAVVVLNIFVIFYIAYSMTNPIIKLANSAEEISTGNFETEDVVVTGNDNELKVMAEAFNTMKHSIREYIEELHDMAETETQLMDEQMRNLQMKSLLDNAELKSLQSQINPHFLFNTLNAGVQLAIMEDADRTAAFMEDVAKIFRYNVQSLDRVVTVRDELAALKAYGNMFEVRYGGRIKMIYDISDDCLDAMVPPLIIQPLVENSAIHGLGEKESGGTIAVTGRRVNETVYLTVMDDGVGIDEETISRILQEDINIKGNTHKSGHTTGIGTKNVIHRLRLFFKSDDVIEITSRLGQMTNITLKIPYFNKSMEDSDV